MKIARPDCIVEPLRGNIDTRLRKLESGEWDAILLAAAGIIRLGVDLPTRCMVSLAHEHFLPASGQGALAIESKGAGGEVCDEASLTSILADVRKILHHQETATAVIAERAFVRTLGGSCRVPIAAHAEIENENVHLRGEVYSPDGKTTVCDNAHAPTDEARGLGETLAHRVAINGGRKILDAILSEDN